MGCDIHMILETKPAGSDQFQMVGNEFWHAVLCPMLKLGKEHGQDNVRAIFFFDN